MRVRSVEQSSFRYLRNSMRAYLEGRKDLRWVASLIGDGSDNVARGIHAFNDIRTPTDSGRRAELVAWFEQQLRAHSDSPQEPRK